MLDNDDLVIIQQRFSKINLAMSIMLLLYYALFVVFDCEDLSVHTLVFSSLIFMLVLEYLMSKRNFWNSDFLYKLVKFVELCITTLIILRSDTFEINVVLFSFIYFMIAFQAEYTFDLTEMFSFVSSIIFSGLPMVVVFLVRLVLGEQSNFWAFIIIMFSVIFVTCITSITYGNSYFLNILYKKINKLNGLASSSIEENDSMKVMQTKLVQSNEQLSIQRFQLEQANEVISKNNIEMKLQSDISKHFSNTLDKKEIVNLVVNSVFANLTCDFVHMGIYSEKYDDLYIYNTRYSENSRIGNQNLLMIENEKFIIDTCNRDEFILHEDMANVKSALMFETDIKSLLIYPSFVNRDIMVVFMIGFCQSSAFEGKRNFLLNIRNQIILSLSNAFLYYEMELMATKDPLTGIFNRRHFNAISSEYKDTYFKDDKNISVVLIDIDKFKKINDSFGHIFGDEVISYIGSVVKKYTRKYNGLPVRYGGEEFVMVFPDKNVEETQNICNIMHEEIKKKEFEVNSKIININASIGIASYTKDVEDFEELLSRADEAMYYSKENGRGRITLYRDIVLK